MFILKICSIIYLIIYLQRKNIMDNQQQNDSHEEIIKEQE